MNYLKVFHDSQSLSYRRPFGAVEIEEKIKLSIQVNKEIKVELWLINPDGSVKCIEMTKEYLNNGEFKYSLEVSATSEPGLMEYYFILTDGYERMHYGNNDERLGGIGQIYNCNPIPYQITVYEKTTVPRWYKEGVIYQIFVDRFFNGNEDGSITSPKENSFIYGSWNDKPMYIKEQSGRIARWDFFGGNLKGIMKKLDYLKSLGISIIYLNPVFKATSCHKYDTGDYEVIDEMFGNNEYFKELCEKAKEIGIRIILDGVFSHTGADSKYFNKFGSYDSVGAYQSKESKYYKWYRFNDFPNKYEAWWGIDNQPNVEELEESYLDYIVRNEDSIVKKWLELGASGWRLDVADELPDKFIEEVKKAMNSAKEDNVLIGEVWEDASNKVSYSMKRRYFYGKELDSVTNYPLREGLINFVKGYIKANKFSKRVMSLYENYPRENFYSNMNILGTHDTERILTILDRRIELLKIIVVLQMTLPGVPLIYYGDEAGIEGEKDPDNRRPYPWGRENHEILNFYKVILEIRNKEEAIKNGNFEIKGISSEVVVLQRVLGGSKIIVLVNSSSNDIEITEFKLDGNYIDLIDSNFSIGIKDNLIIKGYGYRVLKKVN